MPAADRAPGEADDGVDDDVDAYLARLGLEREPPSVDALAAVHRRLVERVPYETTWIHLGERWDVDRRASLRRIAREQRGGYCFHLNGALSLVLEALGYDVTLHVGGVHGPEGPTADAMTNHLVLVVHGLPTDASPDGHWYLDAGLGDALHAPLPLVAGTHEQAPFAFALDGLDEGDAHGADWHLRHHELGSFTGMAFSSRPTTIDAFAERNVGLSTSPESGFVRTVTAQRRDAHGVDVVRGQVLKHVGATVGDEQVLATRTEWFDALGDLFGLTYPGVADEQLDALWARVHATHEAWLASRDTDHS